MLSVRDGGLCYAKLSDVPFPFLPNVWELEDLTIRCGTLVNAGAGWNTFKFPEPFEAVPVVMATVASPASAVVGMMNVSKDGFQYCLFDINNPTVGTGTYYTASGTSSSSSHSAATLVSSVKNVVTTTSQKYMINWIAIEDGRGV